jgi:hypothetical protein
MAIMVAPALVQMGVPVLVAHFFIFYVGVSMFITPPFAPAAYLAAAIAGANPMSVGYQAMKLAIVAYLVPFISIFQPALLWQGTAIEIVLASVTAVIAVYALSVGFEGFFLTPLRWLERLVWLAGGFLLIRFADVMLAAPGVLAALAMIGGFTALFAGLVMLTQPAVKTALAWSTIAQMGFMILQCGLALFPLALLHIIAHSLYKAHAFLAAGGAVAKVAAIPRPGPVAVPGARAVGRAFLAALALYALIGAAFGFDGKSPQAIALGAILVLGVAYLLAQGFADAAPGPLTLRTSIAAAAAAVGYFALQRAAEALTDGILPPAPTPGALEWVLIVLAVLGFGLTAFAQATFPLWAQHPAAAGLRVHLANGLYVNALTDRLLRGWSLRNAA